VGHAENTFMLKIPQKNRYLIIQTKQGLANPVFLDYQIRCLLSRFQLEACLNQSMDGSRHEQRPEPAASPADEDINNIACSRTRKYIQMDA